MSLKFETKFDDNGVSVYLKDLPQESSKAIMKELVTIANEMRNHIIKEMKRSPPDTTKGAIRSGTRYKVKAKNRKYHYPSLPGNFPRIDSGRLAGSIGVESGNDWAGVGSMKVGSFEIANYAKYLEDVKGLNRPFIKPTYEKFGPTIQNRIMEAIKQRASKK